MEDRFLFRIPMFTDKDTFTEFQYIELGEQASCTLCGYNGNPQQSTGLKDKNGKLIYEGDIVNYSRKDISPYSHDILNAIIKFRKFQWCMVYFDNNMINAETRKPAEQKTWLGFDDFITSRIEVIGNIYENADLLKEGKE